MCSTLTIRLTGDILFPQRTYFSFFGQLSLSKPSMLFTGYLFKNVGFPYSTAMLLPYLIPTSLSIFLRVPKASFFFTFLLACFPLGATSIHKTFGSYVSHSAFFHGESGSPKTSHSKFDSLHLWGLLSLLHIL